MTNSSGCLKPS